MAFFRRCSCFFLQHKLFSSQTLNATGTRALGKPFDRVLCFPFLFDIKHKGSETSGSFFGQTIPVFISRTHKFSPSQSLDKTLSTKTHVFLFQHRISSDSLLILFIFLQAEVRSPSPLPTTFLCFYNSAIERSCLLCWMQKKNIICAPLRSNQRLGSFWTLPSLKDQSSTVTFGWGFLNRQMRTSTFRVNFNVWHQMHP